MSSLIDEIIVDGIPMMINWLTSTIIATYFDETYTVSFADIQSSEKYKDVSSSEVAEFMINPGFGISMWTFPFQNSIHVTVKNDAYIIADFYMYKN